MKIYKTKYEYIFPIFLIILWFFTPRLNISGVFYCLSAIIFGFYFFPVRVILVGKDKTLNTKHKIVDAILSWLFSILISFSVVLFYVPEFQSIRYSVGIISFLLFIAFFYFAIKDDAKKSILCILFVFFTSWVMFGGG